MEGEPLPLTCSQCKAALLESQVKGLLLNLESLTLGANGKSEMNPFSISNELWLTSN